MKKVILFAVAGLALLSATFLNSKNTDAPISSTEITWLSVEDAMEAHRKNPKRLFIDMYTDWCGWCKVMDKKTFTHPDVIKTINENYYAVKFNAEQKDPVVFNGKTYNFLPYGRKGIHELAYTLLDQRPSYPSFVLLNEQLEQKKILKGYLTPEQFLPRIQPTPIQ